MTISITDLIPKIDDQIPQVDQLLNPPNNATQDANEFHLPSFTESLASELGCDILPTLGVNSTRLLDGFTINRVLLPCQLPPHRPIYITAGFDTPSPSNTLRIAVQANLQGGGLMLYLSKVKKNGAGRLHPASSIFYPQDNSKLQFDHKRPSILNFGKDMEYSHGDNHVVMLDGRNVNPLHFQIITTPDPRRILILNKSRRGIFVSRNNLIGLSFSEILQYVI